MKKLFLKDYRFEDDNLLVVGGDYHYLRRVRRVRAGDRLSVVIGDDHILLDVVSDNRDHLVCAVRDRRRVLPPLLPSINVYQGLLKSSRMDLVVSKLSELCVHTLFPLRTARTVPRELPRDGRIERWETLSREGAKVTGRERSMRIGPLTDIQDLPRIPSHSPGRVLLFSTQRGTSSLREVLERTDGGKDEPISLVFGPEGGFTEEEISLVSEMGAETVTMGSFVMRAETAAVVGTGFIRVFYV
jgi:16S rRNA (uracil1498-N3)-methyltransferase